MNTVYLHCTCLTDPGETYYGYGHHVGYNDWDFRSLEIRSKVPSRGTNSRKFEHFPPHTPIPTLVSHSFLKSIPLPCVNLTIFAVVLHYTTHAFPLANMYTSSVLRETQPHHGALGLGLALVTPGTPHAKVVFVVSFFSFCFCSRCCIVFFHVCQALPSPKRQTQSPNPNPGPENKNDPTAHHRH